MSKEIKISIKNHWTGSIIFEYSSVDNTLAKTVLEALKGGANLREADLRGANLRGANIDYTCWPLFCGGLHVKINKRIACQLAYHFCNQDCNDPEYIVARNAILSFANQFHRVNECGLLKEIAEFRPQLDDGQTANGEKDGF